MDYDGSVCLKGPELMDLESHYSDPPPPPPCAHYSVHVSMNYMAVFTKGQDCFLNVFFFSSVLFSGSLGIRRRRQAGAAANAMRTVAVPCSFLSVLCLLMPFSQNTLIP